MKQYNKQNMKSKSNEQQMNSEHKHASSTLNNTTEVSLYGKLEEPIMSTAEILDFCSGSDSTV